MSFEPSRQTPEWALWALIISGAAVLAYVALANFLWGGVMKTKEEIWAILESPECKARLREADKKAQETVDYLREASAVDWTKLRDWQVTI